MIYAVATPKIAFSAIKSLTSHSHFLELGCLYPISFWHTHFEEEPFNFLLNWEREGKSQGKSNKSFSSATNYCWPTTFFSFSGNINSISEFFFMLTNEKITFGKKISTFLLIHSFCSSDFLDFWFFLHFYLFFDVLPFYFIFCS